MWSICAGTSLPSCRLSWTQPPPKAPGLAQRPLPPGSPKHRRQTDREAGNSRQRDRDLWRPLIPSVTREPRRPPKADRSLTLMTHCHGEECHACQEIVNDISKSGARTACFPARHQRRRRGQRLEKVTMSHRRAFRGQMCGRRQISR